MSNAMSFALVDDIGKKIALGNSARNTYVAEGIVRLAVSLRRQTERHL